jgi:hypothetical protein
MRQIRRQWPVAAELDANPTLPSGVEGPGEPLKDGYHFPNKKTDITPNDHETPSQSSEATD